MALSKALAVNSAMRSARFTCAWYLVMREKIGNCSVSWKPPRPMPDVPVSGVIATTGLCAQQAAATPVTKLVMPGPFCAMQTPCRPVTRE